MTLSTKCLHEELRRVPSHWASSWRYVCVGCESEVHLCVGTGVYTSMCVSLYVLLCFLCTCVMRACECVCIL